MSTVDSTPSASAPVSAPQVTAPQASVRFGIAHADITPPVGTYHRMWGAATHERSEGVHRPLRATVVLMAEGGQDAASGDKRGGIPLVLVSLDHCLVGDEEMRILLDQITENSGLPHEIVTVVFSHTHGAGLMTLDRRTLPGGEGIPEYLRWVGRTIGKLILETGLRLVAANIVFGQGRCSLAAFRDQWDEATQQWVCGYVPEKPADDSVVVARITGEDGRTLATLVNYACHPTTLAWDNRLISPDYIGALREEVERATGAPCLFIQGASGELGPVEGYVGDVEVADRNGRQLAYASLAALTALAPPKTTYRYAGPVVSGATIGVWKHEPLDAAGLTALGRFRSRCWTIPLEYRAELPTREQVVADLVKWTKAESAAAAVGDEARRRDCRAMLERQTRMARRLEQLPPGDHYPLEVRLWQLGDAFFLAVPGEHYSLLQTALRASVPRHPLLVATIAQGWGPSYLPDRDTYGKGIYQESIAIVAPGSLERVIEEVRQVLIDWTK